MIKLKTEVGARRLYFADDDPWVHDTGRLESWKVLRRTHIWRPPTDVLESDMGYEVVVEIAGMRRAEFSVTFEAGVLSITGVRADLSAKRAYHQLEIAYGEFATDVKFSTPINASAIEATYSDGFLRVVLPRSQAKQISIQD